MPSEETQFALIEQELRVIKDTLQTILKKLEKDYVTQDQFRPVKWIAFGLASGVGAAVLGALVKLILIHP